MTANLYEFAVLFVLAAATAAGVYFLLQGSLRGLLDDVIKLPSCTTFYTRLLAIGLTLITLAIVLNSSSDLKEGAAFMEHVWKVASGLSSVFSGICLFLAGYLFIATILVVVLRRKRE
jgi:hypothetical protein